MIPMVLARQNTEKDIKLSVSKGFYLQKGNIVRIDVKDNNLRGQYRIEQRTIKYKQNSVTCNLTLNKKPIKVSDYISL